MFRDDRQAMALQNEELRREVEHLRRENDALRHAIATSIPSALPLAARGVYRSDQPAVTEAERTWLGTHGLEHFPVWLAALLHLLTFGVFSVIYYAVQGSRLPQVDAGDPGAAKGIGYFFLPYFNLYWLFAFPTRLADRLNLQLKLRGERPMVSQALMVFCALSTALVFVPFFWLFGVVQLQRTINRIVALGPVHPRAADHAEPAEQATGVRVDVVATAPPPEQAWADEGPWQVETATRAERR